MKKRDFETYQKRFRDFEIVPKFSETHVFRGTIRHPYIAVSDSKEVPCLLEVGYWKSLHYSYSITVTYNIIKLVHLLLFITRKYTIQNHSRETATNSPKIHSLARKYEQ